ncbi:hypothetical protein POTOM_018820 [Populus tomentosa]|uniref:Uncharacterized protein n=1 Tax=Populus tomentosa TaxID=118781 RepID=A0A8X8D2L1_POPTO|nr:hypothetical protein POTOM_018820 [Populus tomentosa]
MGGRGRGNRSRTQRKHFRDGRENVWKRHKSDSASSDPNSNRNSDNKTHWQPFSTQNPGFDEYYKEQGIVTPEEWDTFVEVLRTPLPVALGVFLGVRGRGWAFAVVDVVSSNRLARIAWEKVINLVILLFLQFCRSQFCEDIKSQLENDFMNSLKAELTLEAIRPLPWYPDNLAWHSNFSRMQLRKNQTLERFHEFLKLENEIGNITRQEAVSMVIANDLDVQRCNLLIHQTKRMCTANLIISQLLFDRVLCDVPYSGGGTLCKAPDMNPGKGNGLHSLQIQIALRGTLMKYLHGLRFQGNTKVRFEEFGWKFMVAAELGFLAFGDNQGFQGFDFEKSCHGACSVTAENSGMEPDSIDAAVEKNYEVASEADLVVNEPDEAAMEPDLSNISDQNDSEEA